MRNFMGRYFYPHISSGYHNAVRFLNNIINVINSLRIFNLGDNADLAPAIFVQQTADFLNDFFIPHERCGDKINPLADTE